jgi:nitrile hydratase subunit beta
MNGIHDMGGMQDMGPIPIEKDEPAFHERWEARAFALNLATGDLLPKDVAVRFAIEKIPPAEYLRMSYYEKWQVSLENLLVDARVITREEIASGRPAPGSSMGKPALPAAKVPQMIAEDDTSRVKAQVHPRFKVKQRVRARNINPIGHTRLPRYARGRVGTIVRDHGVFAFEDTNASERQFEKPQHVYSVRFSARELWGEQASPHNAVYIDMWDDYLERA